MVAATNTPLEELVEEKKFRRDLFYRLNVYSIHLAPLRERREDILPLAEHFLSTYAKSRNLKFDGFSPEANDLLLNYDFPGNARELRNIVERAAILCRSDSILTEHLNLPERSGSFPESRRETKDDISPQAIQPVCRPNGTGRPEADQERARILKALEETKWNRRQAAKKLGMPYSTLRYKMQKLSIA